MGQATGGNVLALVMSQMDSDETALTVC